MTSHEGKPVLRVMTCGSVDDGKSTLIGRLLYNSKKVFADQQDRLESMSKQFGTQGSNLDFALLVDGLQAEREQGITIDVAYRYFATDHRRFIIADTPGHEQYTRNMTTAASNSDVAILLIDARKGIITQTERHARIVSLMGIRHVILAVNKMDLVDYAQDQFEKIDADFRRFAQALGFGSIICIPVSALVGDNVTEAGSNMDWFEGSPLITELENTDIGSATPTLNLGFQLPVQIVLRPDSSFRGFAGTVAAGTARVGEPIRVIPSGATASIKRLVTFDGDLEEAAADQAIVVELDREVDVSRGDILSAGDHPVEMASIFEAEIFWMGDHSLVPGRQYLFRIHNKLTQASVLEIKHQLDVNSGAKLASDRLEKNDIGRVVIQTRDPVPFTAYTDNKNLGAFVMIDRSNHETAAAGTIEFALRRSSNIHWQQTDVSQDSRAELLGQKPRCFFFTGLSGSGKSTLAIALEKRLHAEGKATYLLDGDNIRHGLNRDLGFTEEDRAENIRRVTEVAKLMVDAGLVVLASFISPYRAERDFARSQFKEGEFVEVFVDTPIEVCEARDIKGLYAKARRGELTNFTGIDAPYEAPENPEIRVNTDGVEISDLVELIIGDGWLK